MFILVPSETADAEVLLAHIQALTQERDRSIDELRALQIRDYHLAAHMQRTGPPRKKAIAQAGPIELVQLLKEEVDEMEERNIIIMQMSDAILRIRQCMVMISQLRFALDYNMFEPVLGYYALQ